MKKFRSISIAFAATLFLAACAQAVSQTTEAPAAVVTEAEKAEPTVTDEPTQAPATVLTEAEEAEPTIAVEPTQAPDAMVTEAEEAEPTVAEEPTQAVEVQPDFEEIPFAPRLVVGGVRRVEASSVGTDIRWILPGLRALDPAIFGTPAQPLGFEPDTGLPLEARLVSEDGTAYTTTAGPTPFSDNFAPVEGSFNLSVVDVSLVDGPDSQDQVDFSASFTGPDGKEYSVTLLKVIPKGPVHPFFGGVATNIIQHGATGIGTSLMPGAYLRGFLGRG